MRGRPMIHTAGSSTLQSMHPSRMSSHSLLLTLLGIIFWDDDAFFPLSIFFHLLASPNTRLSLTHSLSMHSETLHFGKEDVLCDASKITLYALVRFNPIVDKRTKAPIRAANISLHQNIIAAFQSLSLSSSAQTSRVVSPQVCTIVNSFASSFASLLVKMLALVLGSSSQF